MSPTAPAQAAAESIFYCGERYFPNVFDAERHRIWQRERDEREAERFARYLERHLAAPAAEPEDPYAAPAPRLARQRNSHAARYGVRRLAGGAA